MNHEKRIDLVKKEVNINSSRKVQVDLNHPVFRYPGNPVLSAHDVNSIWINPALQVKTVHNAGIAVFKGETIMLFRSHLRSGLSVLGIARSKNGIDNWRVDPKPAMLPAGEYDTFADRVDKKSLIENESGGVEDPRITKIDGTYLITYSAYHAYIKDRVRVSLAATKDFKTFVRYGPVLENDMRNVVIFPEKFNGKYTGLFRPNDKAKKDVGGGFTEIKIGYTDDWKTNNWKIIPGPILKTGGGPSAISDKIGPGAPPIKTKYGWLSIFHGVRTTMGGNPYVLSVMLHDLQNPATVKVSNIPILLSSNTDCRVKDADYIHVPNVVFSCGALRRDDGSIIIYYGGNDTVMNIGVTHEDVLAALCERYAQKPLTGEMCYNLRSL